MIIYYAANGILSAVFAVIYVYAVELFPTDVRSRSMAIQSVFARFGAILSPFVVDIGAKHPELALIIFAVPCVAAGLVDAVLPETRGTQPPNTVADLDVPRLMAAQSGGNEA